MKDFMIKNYLPELITAYIDKEVKCPLEKNLAEEVINDDEAIKKEYKMQVFAKKIVSLKCQWKNVPEKLRNAILQSTVSK